MNAGTYCATPLRRAHCFQRWTISRSEANGVGESHLASITNDPAYGELLRLRITESRL
jgi:hypothetical protein